MYKNQYYNEKSHGGYGTTEYSANFDKMAELKFDANISYKFFAELQELPEGLELILEQGSNGCINPQHNQKVYLGPENRNGWRDIFVWDWERTHKGEWNIFSVFSVENYGLYGNMKMENFPILTPLHKMIIQYPYWDNTISETSRKWEEYYTSLE